MKKVVIVHGWEGYPEEGWFPWLKKELESRGFEVVVPALPDASNPRIEKWLPALAQAVGGADENIYLVGHSLGCQIIVRYLEKLPDEIVVGGAVFVAGFFKSLSGIENEGKEVQELANHWLATPVDLKKASTHIKAAVAIFSDNDYYVPLENKDDFQKKLKAKIIIEKNQGHFSGGRDQCFKLPAALDAILKMSS